MAVPGRLVTGETAILTWANDLPRWVGAPLELGMNLGASIGAATVVVVGFLARKRRVATAGFLAWLAARLVCTIMKAAVDRARPPGLVADVVLRQHLPSDGGFPSSHSAIAAALAVVAGWGWPRLRLPLALGAVLVGLARLYVGVHLPLDLVGGWALGVLCGLLAVAVVHPRVPPHPEPAPWSRRRRTPG
ncbi:MAG TPA: phosphatase PAP2 family protein [Iamia sp.]|nr:phosphatase PAP2 family protein [Iamia sp.]